MDQGQFEGKIDDAAGTVKKAAGDVTGDSKMQAEGMMDQATGKLQQGLGRARETFRGVVDDVTTQARSAAAVAQEQAGTLGEAIEATVHERPLLALAAVGAVGYVLAFLIHRK